MGVNAPAWTLANGCFYFQRQTNGDVRIALMQDRRRPDEDGEIFAETTIDAGIWATTVLDMTVFGERPGDWHPFMDHHQGRRDMFRPQNGYAPATADACKDHFSSSITTDGGADD
jgi:hypothetical protein